MYWAGHYWEVYHLFFANRLPMHVTSSTSRLLRICRSVAAGTWQTFSKAWSMPGLPRGWEDSKVSSEVTGRWRRRSARRSSTLSRCCRHRGSTSCSSARQDRLGRSSFGSAWLATIQIWESSRTIRGASAPGQKRTPARLAARGMNPDVCLSLKRRYVRWQEIIVSTPWLGLSWTSWAWGASRTTRYVALRAILTSKRAADAVG